MEQAVAAAFDLSALDRAFLDDPYPTYAALREHDPVHRMADGSYFLTRYDDLVEVYRDAKTWSSDKTVQFKPKFGDSSLYEHHTTSLVFNDPPIHTRVRKLLAPAFTPRALRALQPRIEALVDRLLDAAAERGRIDLIEDFAAAIPVQLIGDMLGIPQDERGPLRDWSLKILGALEPVLSRRAVHRRRHRGGRFQGLSARSRGPPPARGRAARRRNPVDADRRDRSRRRRTTAATGSRSWSSCTTASSCSTPATRPPPT